MLEAGIVVPSVFPVGLLGVFGYILYLGGTRYVAVLGPTLVGIIVMWIFSMIFANRRFCRLRKSRIK